MAKIYFVTGTDTEVGKTFVAAHLARSAAAAGQQVAVMKPVAAGATQVNGRWVNEDAQLLMAAATVAADYDVVNPFCYEWPIAPHLAAERAGRPIELAPIVAAARTLSACSDVLIVEGAGGWDVPMDDQRHLGAIAQALGAEVVMVVGIRLGCINHALLTARAVAADGLRLVGWVANRIDPMTALPECQIDSLRRRIDAPMLGDMPWCADPEAMVPWSFPPGG